MKKKNIFIFISFCCLIYISFHFNENISNIEHKARISQQIDENYNVKIAKSDKVISFLFYSDFLTNAEPIFSIYTKETFYKSFQFKMGGSIIVDENEIAEYTVPYSPYKVFISMNKGNISYYKLISNHNIKKEVLSNRQPFVIIINTKEETIDFFDNKDNPINTIKL